MILLEIITPTTEKISFIACLLLAVVWLYREISALNKKRDADMKHWQGMYEKMMERHIDSEKNSIKVIEQNNHVIEQFTEVMEQVKDKLKSV